MWHSKDSFGVSKRSQRQERKLAFPYKAEEAGIGFKAVKPDYTSQDCSACGHREKKPLSQRVHHCKACGYKTDRDHNAAINILTLGLQRQAD
ncbi:MAG: transposase [Gemmatimonadetes bacterium]|nr:transposase [Gemmatimonadota bacterium]